jgi:hypothetical protein
MYRENRLPPDLQSLVAAEKPPAIPRPHPQPMPIPETFERARANSIGSRPPGIPAFLPNFLHPPRPQASTPPARVQRRLSMPTFTNPVVEAEPRHDSDCEAGAPPQSPESDLFEWSFPAAEDVEAPAWW